jgi:hypothetical protein
VNVIFLDIDGVLNSIRSMIAVHDPQVGHKPHRSYMERHSDELDTMAILLLRRLCIEADAKIVISSSWRILYHELSDFVQFFADHGWENAPVIGVTPRLDSMRGDEVQRYVFDHPEITKYVIFDDDSDFFNDQPLVHVNMADGLCLKHFVKALDILVPGHKMVTDLTPYTKDKSVAK